jgi:signal peptidase I
VHTQYESVMNGPISACDHVHATKCELAAEVLRSSGTLRLQVSGWSMLPSIWPGDTLLVEHLKSPSLETGDVVLFGRDQRLFAHRVIGRTKHTGTRGILTRGDSMSVSDPTVHPSELLGRIVMILRNGRSILPRKTLRIHERVLASLFQYSELGARVVAAVHGLRQTS